MSKKDEKLGEEEQPRDEQTAKFLHKLAENGKERGLPDCLVAQYEKGSWDNLKTDVIHFGCDKCGCPPPPPIEPSAKNPDSGPTKVCRNCAHVNRKPIGLQTEIYEMQRKEEIQQRQEEKKALKRVVPASSEDNDDVIVVAVAPEVVKQPPQRPPPPRQMPRKVSVAPQVSRMERERARMARELAANNQKSTTMTLTTKNAKKPKLVTEKEPEFLQQLFGIGAKPS